MPTISVIIPTYNRAHVLGRSVQSVLLKYLGINSSNIGHIEYDDAVWNSIRAKNPVINASPSSQSALGIEKVTENLIRGVQ